MARNKLRDTTIQSLCKAAKPGIFSDGDGLYFRVQPSGSKSWVFIWRRNGARHEMGLGAYGSGAGQVSLAAARQKADEARAIIGSGGDPKSSMVERQSPKRIPTFGTITGEYIEAMKSKWRSAATLDHWQRFAKVYSMPIASIPVDEISTDDVLRVLRPIWSVKPETAGKTRVRLKLVLDHARARGLRSGENPAAWAGHISQILPPPKLANRHYAAMPYSDVPALVERLRAAGGPGALALEFLILTAVRSGMTKAATWNEFDLAEKVWTIPAERTKTEKPHRVPLTDRAVEIIRTMQERRVNDFVFPATLRENKPLPKMVLAYALRDAGGAQFTIHGFRSTFRDWVSDETNFQREVAEAALSHAVGDQVERAYRRGDALAKRRDLMQAWANYCSTGRTGDNVIQMREARAI